MKRKRSIKTAIIFTIALAGIVMGVITIGWLSTNSANAQANDTQCEYHGIDVNLCSRCNPELIPEFKAKGDWCAGHNLPESQCDLCDYGKAHEIEESHEGHDHEGHDHSSEENHDDDALTVRPVDIHDHEDELENYDLKSAKDQYKSEFRVFFPDNAIQCATDGASIQWASIKTAERTGLTVREAVAIESSPLIEAPAEIVLDETKTTVLSTIITALVTQWLVEPGQKINRGQLIAKLSSPELPEMKADYLEAYASWTLAKKRLDRQKELYDKDLISDSEFEDGETEFAIADAYLTGRAGMLKSAGLSESDLLMIIDNKAISQTLNIYAPKDGVVIERIAILGKLMDEGSPLAIIGDPGSLWIEARIREEDAPYFAVGDEVVFSSDGMSMNRCSGEIIWVAQFLDKATRSLTVRARIKAMSDLLHSGEFGRVILDSHNRDEMVMIPKDAVQWEGCCNVVFVKESIDRFRPRKVSIEPGGNGYYRVIEGLNAGEEIVVDGSYLMKTELRKGSIGAGCCGL